jgi:hypothetical protein
MKRRMKGSERLIEHFPEKWEPVFRGKMRSRIKSEPLADSPEAGSGFRERSDTSNFS